MKTDRELLEVAAKAAGIRIDKSPYNGGGHGNTGFDCMGNAVLDWHNGKTWNPLTDDGDALRLAVKLRLTIDIERDRFCISVGDHSGRFGVQPWGADGPEAATRRAIVRAAAQIGQGMAPFPTAEEIRENWT